MKQIYGFAAADGSAPICLSCHAKHVNPQPRPVALGEHGTWNLACSTCGRSVKKVAIAMLRAFDVSTSVTRSA